MTYLFAAYCASDGVRCSIRCTVGHYVCLQVIGHLNRITHTDLFATKRSWMKKWPKPKQTVCVSKYQRLI